MHRILIGAAMMAGLALPAQAGTYRLMFDMFSPGGITCEAVPAPGGAARISRSPLGKPVIWLSGDVRAAQITCTTEDGARWQATAQRAIPPGTFHTEGTVALRAGAAAVMTVLEFDARDVIVAHRSFARLP